MHHDVCRLELQQAHCVAAITWMVHIHAMQEALQHARDLEGCSSGAARSNAPQQNEAKSWQCRNAQQEALPSSE